MKNSNTIMCNLEQFKFIQFSWKSKSKKSFNVLLEARKYSKRGLLVLYFDVSQDAWVLKDQFNSAGLTLISAQNYGGLSINFADVKSGQALKRFLKPISPYNFHLFTSEWNTPKFDASRNATVTKTSPRNSWFKKTPVSKPVIEKRLTATELQKDPLVLKKSKYRHATKAFYAKQSDFPRSKFIRASRFASLSGSRGHFSLSYSYSLQQILINFLQWKFDMSVADLQSYNVSNRMTSSSSMNILASWLLTRVPHVLVSTGFCHSYTAANQLIRSGQVKLNDLTLSDINQCVKIGDVITISTLVRPTKFKDSIVPAHLVINWKLGLILVKSNLALTSSFAADFLTKLSVDLKRKKVSGGLKNPLSTLLWRLAPFIRNLGR